MSDRWIKLRRWWHNLCHESPSDDVWLWLDDRRPAPPGWLWVLTVDEAQEALATRLVTRASLDHDLGPGETGYDLVKWLVEMKESRGFNYWPTVACRAHSANPVGRMNMELLIDRYGHYGSSATNR